MPHEVPAALPLIAVACGIACALSPREAIGFAVIALLLIAYKRVRAAMIVLAFAGGLAAALHAAHMRERDASVIDALPHDRFVVVDAPVDRDWTERGNAHVLHVRSFAVNGIAIDRPLAIVARFEPPPLVDHTSIHIETSLRINERGELVANVKSPRLLAYAGRSSWWRPSTWNRALANRLRPFAATHPREVALVEAIALGRGERLDDATRDSYRRGGTYHLLVFSGLQIAFAAGAIALLLRWLRAPRVADWSLLAFAVLAPPFIGPTASVARASVAIGVYAFARILRRPTTVENLWCVAALLRLLFVPGDLTDTAFQLTYAGAAALLFAARGKRRVVIGLIAVEIIITPLTLFHFHQYAIGGSLLTLALTPVLMAMLAVSVCCCAFPCALLLDAMGAMHRLCEILNGFTGDTLRLSGFLAAPPAWTLVLAAIVSLCAIAFLTERRALAIILAFTIPTMASLAIAHARSRVDVPHLTMLDVGQGDALAVRDGDRVMLVDGGGRSDDLRFGETTLLPLLAEHGIRHADVVVLTHAHPDHCGGLPAVVSRMRVGELWINPRRFRGDCAQRLLAAASAHEVPIRLIHGDEHAMLGAIHIKALTADRTFKSGVENNASTVLLLQIGRRRALLTGDIERETESMLATRGGIRADVLKVAHHGSRTSTTAPFIDAVAPRVALISCGRGNIFGHPHPSVVNTLRSRNVQVWRTDLGGTVDLAFGERLLTAGREIDTPRTRRLE